MRKAIVAGIFAGSLALPSIAATQEVDPCEEWKDNPTQLAICRGIEQESKKDDPDDKILYGGLAGIMLVGLISMFDGEDDESAALSFQPAMSEHSLGFGVRYDRKTGDYLSFSWVQSFDWAQAGTSSLRSAASDSMELKLRYAVTF